MNELQNQLYEKVKETQDIMSVAAQSCMEIPEARNTMGLILSRALVSMILQRVSSVDEAFNAMEALQAAVEQDRNFLLSCFVGETAPSEEDIDHYLETLIPAMNNAIDADIKSEREGEEFGG